MIIGIVGLENSGKSSVSDYLKKEYNFKHLSFADSLKEAVGAIFCWPVEMLQGKTNESRIWREEVDEWWAKRLGIPNLTPRWVLQQWGTEVGRRAFHNNIWIASMERKLSTFNSHIVIDDCRFKNEFESVRKNGGIIIKVNRGDFPEWHNTAYNELRYLRDYGYETGWESQMKGLYPDVHISEWGWLLEKVDYTIENNGTLNDLKDKVDVIIKNQ